MAFSQIKDELMFNDTKVVGEGTLVRGLTPRETWKTLWVRVCQRNHETKQPMIAEGCQHGVPSAEPSAVFDAVPGRWRLELPQTVPGSLHEGEAAASAVLVFEADGDLFTLAWAECVHLKRADGGSSHPHDMSS
jgi:hypothetical protein